MARDEEGQRAQKDGIVVVKLLCVFLFPSRDRHTCTRRAPICLKIYLLLLEGRFTKQRRDRPRTFSRSALWVQDLKANYFLVSLMFCYQLRKCHFVLCLQFCTRYLHT